MSSGNQETSGVRNPFHNPFPASLSSECKKAAKILDSFINPTFVGLEGGIPRKILAPAKALVICTVFKMGFLGSVRFGSGLIVARLADGTWSAPSAISLAGLGGGGQFGMELTDFVFVLTKDAAVKTFMESGNLTLGANIAIAFGPGRSAESGAIIGMKGVAGTYAYSKTRGVYGGLTLEGGVLIERSSANKKIYGRKLKVKQLLSGEIPSPAEAESLVQILGSDVFQSQPSQSISVNTDAPVQALPELPQATAAVADDQSAVELDISNSSEPSRPTVSQEQLRIVNDDRPAAELGTSHPVAASRSEAPQEEPRPATDELETPFPAQPSQSVTPHEARAAADNQAPAELDRLHRSELPKPTVSQGQPGAVTEDQAAVELDSTSHPPDQSQIGDAEHEQPSQDKPQGSSSRSSPPS
ncbi:SH3 domain-containing protein [Penicillium argentinense]|uniref:SH3 domain-containing protein n=1 Tax=Penicillium argentinense TaxID=1131581 RepID=A0A9W9KEG8_9EURO|nr:SH3 domain-containing protein [Penicillium argentinense]KAJ5103439.1 SH3 domain-containing protein [Penicillium argentinense]